mgnify:CR=1 FL=1
MSNSIMDVNLTKLQNHNRLLMIPMIRIKLNAFTTAIQLKFEAPSTLYRKTQNDNEWNRINCSPLTDFIFFYSVKNKSFLCKKWIHENGIVDIPQTLSRSEIIVYAYPQTIYKMISLHFNSNENIIEVSDAYTFNFINYNNAFKDCINIEKFNGQMEPSSLVNRNVPTDDVELKYNYTFANNFKLKQLPIPKDFNTHRIIEIITEYMFMNTPNIENDGFLLNGGENYNSTIYVEGYGAKGMFFNSNISPSLIPKLYFGGVYDFRNTFAGMTNGAVYDSIEMTTNSARILESILRDNNSFTKISLSVQLSTSIINNAFKNSKNVTEITANNYSTVNLQISELIDVFENCIKVIKLPSSNVTFTNSLMIAINTFRNCKLLVNNFIEIVPDNAVIFSGVYDGCEKVSTFTFKINSSTAGIYLNNAYILNNLFRNCKSITSMDKYINFATNKDIYADGFFAFCTSLATQPSLSNLQYLISTAEMFRNTKLTSVNYSDITATKNVSAMFMNCTELTNAINFPNAIIASNVYANCTSLTSANINMTNPRYMVGAFKNCTNLTTFTSKNNRTCEVKDVSNLFEGCTSLTTYENSINTDRAESVVNMFKGCTALTSVSLDLSGASNTVNMFYGCLNLKEYDLAIGDSTTFLSMRGTSLDIVGLTNLFDLLPDVSNYIVENKTNVLTNVTWNIGAYSSSKTLYTKNLISNTIRLVPGQYTITEKALTGYSFGIVIINQTTGEIMNTMVYNEGYELNVTVNIQNEGNYYAVINTNYTGTPSVSMVWTSPIYKVDVRGIPALWNLSPELLAVANEKGWQVLCEEKPTQTNAASQVAVFDDENQNETNVNSNENARINIMEDIPTIQISETEWSTDLLILETGYYTLYSKSNINNNFKVYKVLEDGGEYPIAMSYDNSLVCFDINDESAVRIIFNNENIDIELIKS